MVVLMSDFISLHDCYRFCGGQMYWNVLCMVVLVSDFISLLVCYRFCGVN